MKIIKLTKGQFALVDNKDFKWLTRWKWLARKSKGKKTFYAGRLTTVKGKRVYIAMHRLILGLTDPRIIADHIDTNGLNNQRSNLRIATDSQSSCNRNPRINSTSNYKGVSWREDNKKWRARVTIKGDTKSIGVFDKEIDAAKAYNKAAKIIHGEFANLNVIRGKAV